ncbi:hypothetical protein IF1G_03459 [Cordyceps javanica]|uniref:Uncharacterized protein n=1 Tax=Cordyceps javanica TaxID=43265 RepID=A0A545V7L8_9HYPO|nr:hypothetical protein IF1G_03459 [Cordyceps javanica]
MNRDLHGQDGALLVERHAEQSEVCTICIYEAHYFTIEPPSHGGLGVCVYINYTMAACRLTVTIYIPNSPSPAEILANSARLSVCLIRSRMQHGYAAPVFPRQVSTETPPKKFWCFAP